MRNLNVPTAPAIVAQEHNAPQVPALPLETPAGQFVAASYHSLVRRRAMDQTDFVTSSDSEAREPLICRRSR